MSWTIDTAHSNKLTKLLKHFDLVYLNPKVGSTCCFSHLTLLKLLNDKFIEFNENVKLDAMFLFLMRI